MNHSFNTEIAKKYGVDEAIVIENLHFWIYKNKCNEKHFHDGYYWTYNSTRAFKEMFYYWTDRQIDRVLKSLKEQGAILVGNYNKVGYDRTRWFTLTMAVTDIIPFGRMDIPKTSNGFTQNVEPIPDINTVINLNKKEEVKPVVKKLDVNELIINYTDNQDLRTTLIEFLDMRRKQKDGITDTAITKMLTKLTKIGKTDAEKIEILDNSIMCSYKGIFPLKVGQQANVCTPKRSQEFGNAY